MEEKFTYKKLVVEGKNILLLIIIRLTILSNNFTDKVKSFFRNIVTIWIGFDV
jgi:hypothetical protein